MVEAPKAAGSPDCSACPDGFYLEKACTTNTDRICSECAVCGVGMWAREMCTADRDTRCMACSLCPFGTYIAQQCEDNTDTVCEPCSVCDEYSYISSRCEKGVDTVCSSCLVCTFNDIADETERAAVKALCHDGYYEWWALENCCTDILGRAVPCSSAAYMNLEVDAITSRHHWAYNPTSPAVPEGYELGKSYNLKA